MNTDCTGSLMEYMNELNECVNGVCPIQIEQTQEKKTWKHYISGDMVKRLQHELNVQFNARLDEDVFMGDKTL